MANISRDDLIRTNSTLDDLVDKTSQFLNEFGGDLVEGSPANAELQSFERPQSIMTVLSQGLLLAEVATDQLMTLTRSLSEPVQTVAPWTCLRSMLEASALAIWFLEPTIDVRLRVQRSFAFRYEGLVQQRKWMRAAHESELEKAETRISSLEKTALSLGYERILDRNHKMIGLGQGMPSVTEIIMDVFDEEATYRLLSAVAHGHHWALTQLGFRLVPESEEGKSGWAQQINTHTLEKSLQPNLAAYICLKAAIAFSKTYWCMCRYCGWWNERAESLLDQAFDAMNLRDEFRFWKQGE